MSKKSFPNTCSVMRVGNTLNKLEEYKCYIYIMCCSVTNEKYTKALFQIINVANKPMRLKFADDFLR